MSVCYDRQLLYHLEYAIAVTRGDQVIAYVKNEEDFNQAAALVEQQIVYVEDEQSVDLSAEFELAQVANPEEIVDQQTLANRLISSSDVEIAQAPASILMESFAVRLKM